MKILAIETSCDDTAVAVVENGRRVLVSLVASQEKLHAQFGGVVPEVASRRHLETIYPLVKLALERARLTPAKINAIAVTTNPGLLGSLLVGVSAAKTLGYLWDKPVVGVNHLLGHIYAGWLGEEKIQYPLVSLVTSGGHSEIVMTCKEGEYKYVGGTRDDAAGEAFDKVARVLKLGYPGGPAIAAVAAITNNQSPITKKEEGVAAAAAMINNQSPITKKKRGVVRLPRPMIEEGSFDFSFSGLKTAVSRVIATSHKPLAKTRVADIAYEFQEAVVEVLSSKLFAAAKKYNAKTILIGGGVAANKRLREEITKLAHKAKVKLVIPEFKYCTDNAAMIGAAAYFTTREERGVFSPHRRLAKPTLARARTSRLLPTPPSEKQKRSALPSLKREKYKWYNANVVTD